jgi:protein TonB
MSSDSTESMGFSEKADRRSRLRNSFRLFFAVSIAVHVAISGLAFLSGRMRPRVQAVRTETQVYPARLYLPGGSRNQEAFKPEGRKKHVPKPAQKTSELARNIPPAPPAGAPVATQHDAVAGTGTDAQNAQPAFPVFSPRPQVSDRSLLPGSDQQVIVDVKVSAVGEVLQATLVKGIGNALDNIVLETVKTWRFHPATIDGTPVATESELIFPFNSSYPTVPS